MVTSSVPLLQGSWNPLTWVRRIASTNFHDLDLVARPRLWPALRQLGRLPWGNKRLHNLGC